MFRTVFLVLAVVAVVPPIVSAQGRTAVAPEPGLVCMSLRMTEAQAMDPAFVVPLRSAPSATAPSIGQASAIVLVRSPEVVSNGFVKAVLFNGREGWIAAADIKPWHNPGGSGQRCIPSRMSDGSIGFAFR